MRGRGRPAKRSKGEVGKLQLFCVAKNGRQAYRCDVCHKTRPLLEGEGDVFSRDLSLRRQAIALFEFAFPQVEPSVTDVTRRSQLHPKTVRQLFTKWRRLLAEWQKEKFRNTRLGGDEVEVEMDEVCFRTKAVKVPVQIDEDLWQDKVYVQVLRYLGIFERVSFRYVLVELPDSFVKAGGGGPIRKSELWRVLRTGMVLPGSIIHTDSAAAYSDLPWANMTESVQEVRDHNPQEKAAAREEREELERELVNEVARKLEREEAVMQDLFEPQDEEAVEREGGARAEVSLCSSCGAPENEEAPLVVDGGRLVCLWCLTAKLQEGGEREPEFKEMEVADDEQEPVMDEKREE